MVQIIETNTSKRTAVEELLRQAGYMTQSYQSGPEYLSAALGLKFERGTSTNLRARLRRLTPRQTQVFVRVVRGRLNKEIAREFGTCEQAVKYHRSRVMAKMQAGTFAELVRMAERLGISA